MNDGKQTKSYAEWAKEVWNEGAETMWRNAIADTVIGMLERGQEVTRDSLRSALETQVVSDNTPTLYRSTLIGAVKALDGNPPS